MIEKIPCDFCGRPIGGTLQLERHETACEKLPPEIRTRSKREIVNYQQLMRSQANHNSHTGEYPCPLENCGFRAQSAPGLSKHVASCRARSPDERKTALSILAVRNKYGHTYRNKKRDKSNDWASEVVANGTSQVHYTSRIEPNAANDSIRLSPASSSKMELTISLDKQGLAELVAKFLPEILSLVRFDRLERK